MRKMTINSQSCETIKEVVGIYVLVTRWFFA
jgi:hypothetical protein